MAKNRMKDIIYLRMNSDIVLSMTKNPPVIKPKERYFKIHVSVPNKIFESVEYIGKMEITEEQLANVEQLEFELNLIKKRVNDAK